MNLFSKLGTFALVVAFIMATMLGGLITANPAMAEGEIQIDSCEELALIGYEEDYPSDANYILPADGEIDCSMTNPSDPEFDEEGPWGDEEGFLPLRYCECNGFEGSFDGQGATITGLFMNRPGNGYHGLFTSTEEGSIISNLTLEDVTITSDGYTGALVGRSLGDIDNVHVRNVILTQTGEDVGGLVGFNSSGVITDSSVVGGSIENNAWGTGGLVGENDGTIERSYASINVESSDNTVGGLIGYNEGVIRNSYATGNVTSSASWAGGFGGYNWGQIYNSYASGNVEATNSEQGEQIGGFVGDNGADTIYSSFSVGSVTTEGDGDGVGGFLGTDYLSYYNGGWWTGSYDVAIGYNYGPGEPGPAEEIDWNAADKNSFKNSSYGFYGVTSEDEGEEYSSEEYTAWDFDSIWTTNGNTTYPVFNPVISDEDDDGISDSVENAGPNDGDANNDGTPDSEQANVASYVNAVNGDYSVLEVSDECSISSVVTVAESGVGSADIGFDYPSGLMDFSINCGTEGFTADIAQYHYGVSGDFAIRKFKPATGYFTVSEAVITDLTIAGSQVKKAAYQVTDGESLDIDGEVNGIIEDPAGLGENVLGVPDTGLPSLP